MGVQVPWRQQEAQKTACCQRRLKRRLEVQSIAGSVAKKVLPVVLGARLRDWRIGDVVVDL